MSMLYVITESAGVGKSTISLKLANRTKVLMVYHNIYKSWA